jgi:phosphatidylserine decarboxylase
MVSLHPKDVDKPAEKMNIDSFPDASHDDVAKGLSSAVAQSAESPEVGHHIHAPMHSLAKLPWVHHLIPGIEKLAVEYHCGNYVVVRGTNEPFFETMPLYAR